jgi:hypothetical protein
MRLTRISRTVACLAVVARVQAALPEPPRQRSSWIAVRTAGLPDYVPDIVAMLFDSGLADPRDGEYREVEIHVSQGQAPTTTTHGWFFRQGFAVCWDGRVHHVEHAGPPADLQTDVSAAQSDFGSEATIHAPPSAKPVGVALLMRLGETELARKILLAMPPLRGNYFGPDSERFDKPNWFQLAVTSWLSGVFHQAVEAHASGDDQLTIDITQVLQTARPLLESSWTRMEHPPNLIGKSPLDFLEPVPVLRADSERRLKQPPRAPLNAQTIKQMPRAERIRGLIDRLEDVNEQQFSQPGGVWIMGSPICKLLAEEDADAIDPLLDAFDHDTRLTRSFSYGRNFFPPRHLISVSEAARAILSNYYQIEVFRWKDNAQARAWMVRNKYRTVAQRGLDLLADDSNDEIQWLDAAQLLLRSGKSGFVGEELRGNRSPSVSELLAKRAREMNIWAIDVGLLLYKWDPDAALPALQMLAHRWDGAAQEGRIAAARLQLGDSAAAREWAAAIHPNQDVSLAQLAPLWTSPANEDLQAPARKLFAEPGAPLSPTGRRAGELINSTLLINPVFRECVLAGLERTEEIGSAERTPDGTRRVTGPGSYQQASAAAGLAAHPPGKRSIRVGDFIAWQLSEIEGFPKFDIEWTTTEKDAALAAMAGFLRARADDLRPVTSGTPLHPGVTLVQE